MTRDTVRYELRHDAVGVVTLHRPDVLNAYSLRMRDELWELLTNLRLDDELRVLVIRGAGRAFCAGADLSEFGTAPSPLAARRIRFDRDVWKALREFPVPTVAVLHGHVIGSGLELALHCALRFARPSARLAMPEAALGLIPAAGGTQTLPRVAGPSHAVRMIALGEPVDAGAALALGLVDRVLSGDDADEDELWRLVRELAGAPRGRLHALMRLLRLQDGLGLRDAIGHEAVIGRAAEH
jgi:enoyl-CoA hydratase/carnithine racemase